MIKTSKDYTIVLTVKDKDVSIQSQIPIKLTEENPLVAFNLVKDWLMESIDCFNELSETQQVLEQFLKDLVNEVQTKK